MDRYKEQKEELESSATRDFLDYRKKEDEYEVEIERQRLFITGCRAAMDDQTKFLKKFKEKLGDYADTLIKNTDLTKLVIEQLSQENDALSQIVKNTNEVMAEKKAEREAEKERERMNAPNRFRKNLHY